ncbi:hypothetical protein [Cohnella fermenti]|uniref:Uncharacterized protein n=1 Tax=Cohnella fermenti TaxID=2565925 RepID=A0A4S4C8V5_9BACL|nr:hypothetical protein [Cohnella fermenti]THF84479.1 hypothetical protein E6C55_00395 [Cohnella fermenti]
MKAADQPIGCTDRGAEDGHSYDYKVTTLVSDGVKWGYGDESSASSNVIAYPEETAEAPAPAASLTGPSQTTAGHRRRSRYRWQSDYPRSYVDGQAGGADKR